MRIQPQQHRVSSHELLHGGPPGRKTETIEPSLVEDTVELSTADPAETGSKLPRVPIAMALGWTMMAASRMLNIVPAPAIPAIICATSLGQEMGGTRLQQVLSCEKVSSAAELRQSIHRANYAWEGLRTHTGEGLHDLKDRPGAFGRITAWPYGQVMAASLDQAKIAGDYAEFDSLVQGLERLRHPDGGYASSKGPLGILGARFYDDNAWLGLVFVQAALQSPDSGYLEKAEEIASFLRDAQQPDGGVLWEEGNPDPSYNTCTFGPTIELSLRLYQATGDQKHLDFARDLTDIMESKLRMPNGLYADLVKLETGKVDPTVYSYNQGTPVGAHKLWYDITGDETHLAKARETAAAALQHFGEEGLWKQSPAFNAVFFRNLMQLEDPAVDKALDSYLDKAWSQALDPATGLFNREGHGMGSYEGHGQLSTIDQAGLVQLYALRDWSAADRHQIT